MSENSSQPDFSEVTVLIVDDDEAVRDSLCGFLTDGGWQIQTADSAETALEIVRSGVGDIVVTDVRMPGMDGIELLDHLRDADSDIEVLVTTGHSTEDTVIRALRAGAFDYFRKPLNGSEIAAALERTQRVREVKLENKRLKALLARLTPLDDKHSFIVEAPCSRQLLAKIEKVSASPNATVLLTGESGVGKEVVARMIHRMSRPVSAPFVPVNCGGLAETLLESELFGHEKGAFTGADRQIPGVFEMAKGGTVFLDEISEMSAAAQSRFLRVIEDRTVRRVRGTKEIGIENTRIITATNQDLQNLVATGKFRKDLYYRTMVAPIDIPPLRERPEDILPLAYYFLDRFSRDTNRTFRLSGRTDRALLASDFPGNIRDLRNMIERGTIFASRDIIEPEDMGLSCDSVSGDVIIPEALDEPLAEPVSFSLADNEKHLIERAIDMHGDNHSATARSLGITPQALYRKIDKHGLRDS